MARPEQVDALKAALQKLRETKMKVGERTDLMSKVHELLSVEQVRNTLDQGSSEEAGTGEPHRTLTWRAIVKSMSELVDSERSDNEAKRPDDETKRDAKRKATAPSYKRDCFTLWRTTIEIALANRPTNRTKSVSLAAVEKTLANLFESDRDSTFGYTSEALDVLVLVLQNDSAGLTSMKADDWSVLFGKCCSLVRMAANRPTTKIKLSSAAHAVSLLASALPNSTRALLPVNIHKCCNELHSLFQFLLVMAQRERPITHLLQALNSLLTRLSIEYRNHLAELGLGIAPSLISLISLWTDDGSDKEYQKLLATFFNFLFVLHQPDCVSAPNVAVQLRSDSEKWASWKNVVKGLYEHLVAIELSRVLNRAENNQKAKKEPTLMEEQIELIARTIVVCHEFGDEISLSLPAASALMSTTLNNQTRGLDTTASGAAPFKRRLIQVGYVFLLDLFIEMATKRRFSNPCYQILSKILSRWSHRLAAEDYDSLIIGLVNSLAQLKRQEAMKWTMRTIAAALPRASAEGRLAHLWPTVLDHCLVAVRSRTLQSSAGVLLVELLKCAAVPDVRHLNLARILGEVYSMDAPTEHAVESLTAVVGLVDFDERVVWRSLTNAQRRSPNRAFRLGVVEWLLQVVDEDELNAECEWVGISALSSIPVQRLSKLAAMLCVQYPNYSLSNTESRCPSSLHPWTKMEQALIDAFALSSCHLPDRLSSSNPVTESLPLPEVVSAVIEQFANGSSAVRSAFKTTSDSPRSRSALVRHLNFGLALSGLFNSIGCNSEDHEDLVALNQEIELLTKLVVDKALTNASNGALFDTLSALGRNCVNAPLLNESLILRLARLASNDLRECVSEDSPDENSFIRPNDRKRCAPTGRAMDRQLNDRNGCSIEEVQRAAWECLLRFCDSESNAAMIVPILERQASNNIEPWMLESVLTIVTRPLPSFAKLLLCSGICGSVRERIDALSRAKSCCSQKELLEIWSQLWSIVKGGEEPANKQRLLSCIWDIFDMTTVAQCQVEGSRLTTVLLKKEHCDAAQLLKLAQVASASLFTIGQLSALLQERALSENDQTEKCRSWLNSLTFFRLVASIVTDHSAVDLHPVALFRLLVFANGLPDVWRLFLEQLIPNLVERISWHFSSIAYWWIKEEISLDKFPLAIVGCSTADAFFERFANDVLGAMLGAPGAGLQYVRWMETISERTIKAQNGVGLRVGIALICADPDGNGERFVALSLRDFVGDTKYNKDAVKRIWPEIVCTLIKWQCSSPIQAPQMSAKSVKRAISCLMIEMKKASLTMACNDGLDMQKNELYRKGTETVDCLLVMCAELRRMALNSCGQYANALQAFHLLLFELDLQSLHRCYLPYLAREAWWMCTVCIQRSVREKRQQNYVALLVRLWAEISERLLSSGRSAIDRFGFAVSSVMELLEQQEEYAEASAEAVNHLMKWLKKFEKELTWTAIPMPPIGSVANHLRHLIVEKRRLLLHSASFELNWLITAELHLLTVGYWQYLRELLESFVAENSRLTVNERQTGKLLALWQRYPKWRRWLAPILALLPNDSLLLDQSLLPPTKSTDVLALDWANRLLFETSKYTSLRVFNAVPSFIVVGSTGTLFDAEATKTSAMRYQELLPFRHDYLSIMVEIVSRESDKFCFFSDEWPQPISFEFWMQKTAAGVVGEAAWTGENHNVPDGMLLRPYEAFIALNTEFAQALLPVACETLIWCEENMRKLLASEFNNILSAMKCASKVEEEAKVSIALALLEILRHVSSDTCRSRANKRLSLPPKIPLDYALLADVLATVQMPYAALFYAEIACDEKSESFRPTQLFDDAGRSLLDSIDSTNNGLRRTMKSAVMQLGDVDSLKGLGEIALVDKDARCFLAEHNRAWERMVSLYSRADSPAKFAKALRMMGVDDDQAPLAVQYENAWKLGRWQQLDVPKKDTSLDGRLFGVLNAVKEGNGSLTDRLIRDLLQCNMEQICQLNVPDAFHLRWHGSIVDLQQLTLNDQANENVPELCRAIDKSLRAVDSKRESAATDAIGDELAMETSLLLAKLAATSDVLSKELTFHTLSNVVTARARALRKSQAYQQSIRLVAEWHKLVAAHSEVQLPPAFRLQPALEAASSLWKSDDLALAVNQVESIINELNPNLTQKSTSAGVAANEKLLQVVSKSYALLAKLKSCNGGDQDAALKEACAVLERANVSEGSLAITLSKMNWRLGKYTEAKYRTLRAYRESAEFKAKEMAVENWNHQMTALTDRYLLHRLRSECRLEKMDIESSDNLLRSLLIETVRRYITAMRMGDAHDLSMYLLIDLWMDNRDDLQLCALIREEAALIASHKWLLVWNQLSSRVAPLENDCAQLRSVIETLLARVAHDHPYHTINSLLYIGEVDTVDAKSLSQDKNRIDRIDSSRKILAQLKKGDRARVVKDMYDAHQAFRQVADTPITLFKESKRANSKGILDIPANMTILKLATLKNVPIPTMTIPVDKSFKYSEVVRFSQVQPHCSKADGRSMPKVLRVIGSDGIERRIIFKSGDDVRQDILVQQVFTVANSLLTSSKQPGCMRTYNVVPLSHGAGLIEWCEHTMSLCNYLIGANKTGGAHAKYYPSDITGSAALLRMKKAADEATKRAQEAKQHEMRSGSRRSTSQQSDPTQLFRSICEQFRPVFRHFFYERFADPIDWYRRRNDYTVNVATWSMVCHLVGLGDRHLNNILIDERTAELVHIDLGMAFEFSRRALSVPETVPFRLTRDMVDPMGAWGIDGLFTATCTRAMTVMRANKSVLLSVVSILLHDPVASFQEMPVKKDEKTPLSSKSQPPAANRNSLAETAIARMTEKLSGRETIDKVEMTVDRQVAFLIDEARNPDNLSRMYFGWMPFV